VTPNKTYTHFFELNFVLFLNTYFRACYVKLYFTASAFCCVSTLASRFFCISFFVFACAALSASTKLHFFRLDGALILILRRAASTKPPFFRLDGALIRILRGLLPGFSSGLSSA